MPFKTNNQILLSNNKTLGYAEYGDLHGSPVLYFHGLPSSRFELNIPECVEVAERLHARVIVVDRPGIGLSDFWPYTIAGFPDIITEFADRLGLDRFAVMGTSSGAKYVVACAWKIPERLTTATVISGTAPFDFPSAKHSLSKLFQVVYKIAGAMPWAFRLLLRVSARTICINPLKSFSLFGMLSATDKLVLSRQSVFSVFRQMIKNSVSQGARGGAHDWRIEAQPWGFSLREIAMAVTIHHGEDDRLLAKEHSRILALNIPNAHLKIYQGEGHTLFANQFEELLGTVYY